MSVKHTGTLVALMLMSVIQHSLTRLLLSSDPLAFFRILIGIGHSCGGNSLHLTPVISCTTPTVEPVHNIAPVAGLSTASFCTTRLNVPRAFLSAIVRFVGLDVDFVIEKMEIIGKPHGFLIRGRHSPNESLLF